MRDAERSSCSALELPLAGLGLTLAGLEWIVAGLEWIVAGPEWLLSGLDLLVAELEWIVSVLGYYCVHSLASDFLIAVSSFLGPTLLLPWPASVFPDICLQSSP